ncbi:MAG: NifB/NifX family molybdenum-iron cluster-binding protein [Thermodesulfobacteriota bacterium]|nr:NifB/NifX family molybdenum-iron cluster-binding protein [Thermodesulfobacteriota bacterium]
MRIAIPIWDDKISPVLDTASRLLIVEVEDRREASRFETYLDVQDLPGRCFRIQGLGVDILICSAISRPFLRRLMASGIKIIPGISGHPEDVLEAYLKGTLSNSRFLMPGCKKKRFGQGKMKTLKKQGG